jgi:D-methionine transport system permease protein
MNIPVIVANGLLETLYMTLISTALAYVLGLPLGVLLTVSDKQGIHPMPAVYKSFDAIVNILRSVPFLILLIAVMPLTRIIVGTTIGSTATIVPLVIAAFPFIARLVEASLREVDKGVIEAAQSMGAGNSQIIVKVLLREATPSLMVQAAIATTTILSFSAMAGIVGGGGLGAIAINYGYYRGDRTIMLIMVAVLVIVVQVLQAIGMWVAKKTNKRNR